MNIWLVNPFSDLPNEGASEGRFCCLARVLAEQGHSVTWWTVDFHHRKKAQRVASKLEGGCSGLEIILLPVPAYQKNISFARLRSHRAYGKAFAAVAATRIASDPSLVPDVIHLSVPPLDCVEPALALKRQLGCRVTVDVMDLWPETFTRLIPGGVMVRRVVGRLILGTMFRKAQLAYREADGVSAVSQEYLDVVARHRLVNTPSDMHLCYVGGDLVKGPHASRCNGHVSFIYVGAMTPTYDLKTILQAALALKGDGCEFEVVFAGGGVSEVDLKAYVTSFDLNDCVRFLGFLNQDQLRQALVECDVGLNTILPGTFITMPHKLSDYLCAGLAVINSTEGEADDLLRQNKAGTFYEARNVDSLAMAMRGYIESQERVINEKAAALSLAEACFDRSNTYREMADWVMGDDCGQSRSHVKSEY
jgi:glycosyltransferase involved in cell wall biosynthesis